MIPNGDHMFLVIGRNPYSDPANYISWGSSAVICDPWGGYAIPASEITSKNGLTTYYYHKTADINVIIPFDPHYHKLRMHFKIPKKDFDRELDFTSHVRPGKRMSGAF